MSRVLRLSPQHALARAERGFLARGHDACPKCESTFVVREPAFLHCRYCGAMSRLTDGSLAAQELYELRSGLRVAC